MKVQTSNSQTGSPQPEKINRRTLLTGTAGDGLGAILGAPPAFAQQSDRIRVADHGHGGVMSNRVYSVNPSDPEMADIAENPANVPLPIERREPATIDVELETIEVEAHLSHNSMFRFWTFNGTVPGPMIRVRVGDTVNVRLRNHPDSWMMHNVDFHAATGPGGGAEATSALPDEEKGFSFNALKSGIYVYHCAVPPVALHIANGMYGMILVEPEEGLPPVDKEFYVMQGEIYTEETFGTPGSLIESYDKMMDERPEYFILNGHVGALTDHYPLQANVGEIFDKVYQFGSFASPPLEAVQTVTVPPGGAVAVEFKCEVPGRYVLVDHALSRVERGLAGYLIVEGEEAPDIFSVPEE